MQAMHTYRHCEMFTVALTDISITTNGSIASQEVVHITAYSP